jgi:hypothetical protein
MIKRFYSSGDARVIKSKAYLMFEELSDGVYLVVEDKSGDYEKYVTSTQIASALNYIYKVAVTHAGGGSGYTNFDWAEG